MDYAQACGRSLNLTVGHERNKLALNLSIGRNAAGIHYRIHCVLGEQVTIGLLEEQESNYNKPFSGFWLTASMDQ
ncbi:hypothetical protein HNV11_11555 [Spirosoma taeanense]|uniref:Uncharacterized protein n=1 Tax=Spirosoma taeanense TaxID=2735870 RepID=A0A6M5Y9C2_9BACT|nr:hypothetical protein [Spirosoma taeanense]QJW89966.1 hypothetical protein HNV11_11555 [Spirosoma taeanense]